MSLNAAKGLFELALQMCTTQRNVPKVHLHVFERAFGDASTTVASWLHTIAVVRHFLSLAAHASLATVEDRRGLRCGVASPVPVWLRAVIPAFDG